jgi:hypothetical protein
MSAFTDRLHAFFSRFAEVSKTDLAEVETAVEEKLHPIVNAVKDEASAELAAAKTEWATAEQQLKQRIADLETKVEQLLAGQRPAPAPAPAEPPAQS